MDADRGGNWAMGFEFGFNNPNFSDRILRIEVANDPSDSELGKQVLVLSTEQCDQSLPQHNGASSCKFTTLHICSLVLASKSPFFYKMFSNGMKESEQREVTLSVHTSEEVALLDLLQFMYSDRLKENTAAYLIKVLILADRYQVIPCITYCAQTLSSFPMTFELAFSCANLPSSLLAGDDVQLQFLIDKVKCFISKNISSHYKEALSLPLESFVNILSWETLEIGCEDEVFDLVLDWAKTHYKDLSERRQVFNSRLFRLICLPYMSAEKLSSLLHCEELEHGDTTKKAMEVLLMRTSRNPLSSVDAKSSWPKRIYRLRPVKVIVLDSPFQECTVYWELRKEELAAAHKNEVQIRTENFHVGDECFYLWFIQPGILLVRESSTSRTTRVMIDWETAVRSKTSGKFLTEKSVSWDSYAVNSFNWCGIGDTWDSFMGEDSKYFYKGVLYLKVLITFQH